MMAATGRRLRRRTPADDGRYSFVGAPALGAGELYSVNYSNTTDDPNPGPGYLWSWSGNRIASYTAGQSVAGGDFDVADVLLASPDDGASVTLPAEFCWIPRGIAGDNYRLVFWHPDTDGMAASDFMGDSSCVTISGLPEDWPSGVAYLWWVRVYQGANPLAAPYNNGASYGDREVTIHFSAAARPQGSGVLSSVGERQREASIPRREGRRE